MKKRILAVAWLVIMLLPAMPARADDPGAWTWDDTALQTVFAGLLAADWAQTLRIVRDRDFCEVGADRFIGRYPTKRDVNQHFAGMLLIHSAIAALFNKPYRTAWQGAYILYEYDIVQDNRNVGLGISLRF